MLMLSQVFRCEELWSLLLLLRRLLLSSRSRLRTPRRSKALRPHLGRLRCLVGSLCSSIGAFCLLRHVAHHLLLLSEERVHAKIGSGMLRHKRCLGCRHDLTTVIAQSFTSRSPRFEDLQVVWHWLLWTIESSELQLRQTTRRFDCHW